MTASHWVDATVCLDDLGPYPAQILVGQRWNGWVIPRFTPAVVERIAADLAATHAARGVDPLDVEIIRFDGDIALTVRAPGTTDEEIVDRQAPDPAGRYRIGGFRWCWSTMDKPTSGPAAETADDSGPVPRAAATVPDLPAGARLLSADEAVALLVTGEHPEAATGSLALDAALVESLRAGAVLACRLPDGRVAFTRPGGPPPA